MSVRIRPTLLGAKGVLFLAAIALAFFATSYSNLFFLLLGFLCVLAALGALWAVANVRGVTVAVADLPQAPAGSARELRLRLGAAGRPRFQLAVFAATCDLVCEAADVAVLAGEARVAGRLCALP